MKIAYFISINQVFRANFATDFCLVQRTNFVLRGMNKRFHTGMILIDLQKAFDILDHTVVLQKMERISFKESIIKWFQSSLKQEGFCDTRECFLRCWTNKLWCSTRIYFRGAPLPNIYK